VKQLTGVFDPPPETLAQPWLYLASVIVGATAATSLGVWRTGVTRQEGAIMRAA
jgi:putative ABC transport system permease protein